MDCRPWAYRTADLPAIPATFKQSPDDFVVTELPLFDLSGAGEHLYVTLTKRGLTTPEAVERLAAALRLDPRAVGFAGLKDKQALATQTVSLPGVDPAALEGLELPGIELLAAVRHTHKLRRGKLAGNRFRILLRDVDPARAGDVARAIERIAEHGAPNYFGAQRFGLRLVNHLIGRALLLGEWSEAAALLCGRPSPNDADPRVRRARELFDAGRFAESADCWPPRHKSEAAVARTLAARPGDARGALRRMPRRERGFLQNALQSYLFNSLLEQVVESGAEKTTPPFGELPGYKSRPSDAVLPCAPIAAAVLPGVDLAAAFRRDRLPGGRRALWLRPAVAAAWEGATLTLELELPAGAYATAVLREITKDDPPIPRCCPSAAAVIASPR